MPAGLSDLFFNEGNASLLESVKNLRLGKIVSVDTVRMMADVQLEGETSSKQRVPLPMPMASPGGGIFAIPTKGTFVILGIRAAQFPIILGYYPSNVSTPDSAFSAMRQIFGLPDRMEEGDILIRSRGDSARCDASGCGKTSRLEEWRAATDPKTGREKCPKCGALALENPEMVWVENPPTTPRLNKKQLGVTLHLRSDGMIFLQADNLTSKGEGHTERLFKLSINGITGDVSIDGANDISVQAKGDVAMRCKNATVTAEENIAENANNMQRNAHADVVETSTNHTINPTDTLRLAPKNLIIETEPSDPLNLLVKDDSITLKTSGRMETIGGDDALNVSGDLTEMIDGERYALIGRACNEVVGSPILPADKIVIVYGETAVFSYKGVKIGAVGSDLTLGASKQVKLWAGGAALPVLAVARKTDTVISTPVSDVTFFTFLSAVVSLLGTILTSFNSHTHLVTTAPGVTGTPVVPIPGAAPAAPGTVTGKITTGNEGVLA